MFPPILKSKISIPPVTEKLIVRQRVFALLDEGLQRRLTIISAPAGYGKTTLVSSWLLNHNHRAAWVTLDSNDQDFAIFFSHLIFALETHIPDISYNYQNLSEIQNSQTIISLMQDLLSVLGNFDREMLIILDDYHNIKSKKIHEAIHYLINYLPKNIHVYIISRAGLPFCISNWLVKNYIQEITVDDLTCNDEEAYEYLNRNFDQEFTIDEVISLNNITEGWVTGLKLAALSIQRNSSPDRAIKKLFQYSHYFSDYILEEVFSYQNLEVQDFLLKTSVLEEMSAPLCNALGPFSNSRDILDSLEKENVFIFSLDQNHQWYRYHQLFHEFLYKNLEREYPEKIAGLHRRAYYWFLERGMFDHAVKHALCGELFYHAAELIDQIAPKKWERGEFEKLIDWLEMIPLQEIIKFPDLLIFYTRLLFYKHDFDKINIIIENLDINKITQGIPKEKVNDFLARLAITKGNIAMKASDIPKLEKAIAEAEGLLSPEDWKWKSNLLFLKGWLYERRNQADLMEETYRAACILCGYESKHFDPSAITFLANYFFATGVLEKTIETCQTALNLPSIEMNFQNLLGIHHLILGATFYHMSRLEDAITQLQNGLEKISPEYDILWRLDGLYFLILTKTCLHQKEDINRLEGIYDIAFQESGQQEVLKNHYLGLKMRLDLHLGKTQKAAEWSQLFNPDFYISANYQYFDFNSPFLYTVGFDRLTLARYKISEEDYKGAQNYLKKWLQDFQNANRRSELIEALILLALTYHRLDDQDQAVASILEAIRHAQPDGYMQLFRNETGVITDILQGVKPYHFSFLGVSEPREFKKIYQHLEKLSTNPISLDEKFRKPSQLLTPRELEILQSISRGDSNQEIAVMLCITENTLRTHIKKIYQKLEAQSRTHAIYQAKALGIIG